MHVGTTTVENLLRVARSEAAAVTAFAALVADGQPSQIVSVPPAGTSEGLSPEELAELVRQASTDPEFVHARVFVRGVQMRRALTLAVAPLRDGAGRSMIGVVADSDRHFEPAQLEVLERLAERFLRHLQVLRQMNGDGASDDGPPDATSTPSEERQSAEARADETRATEQTREEVTERPGAVWSVAGAEEPPPTGRTGEVTVEGREPSAATAAPAQSNDVSPAPWWSERDPLTGLPSLGQFFSRTGRMLAAARRTPGALALVVVDVPEARTTTTAARALSAQLRFSDPVVRVDGGLLAAAVLLFPTGNGEAVDRRLGAAVRSAVDQPGAVRTAHVVTHPGDRRDVDELLREALSRLADRDAGGGGAPWRGAGGSAARLPIP